MIVKKIQMNNTGTLVISLDFELLWGVFDVVNYEEKTNYFLNTRYVIPKILEVFEKFNIEATWATVGMLFNENWDEWNHNVPDILPEYRNSQLSAYKFGKKNQNKNSETFCFAPQLIQQIKTTPGQEIGTHTYSHYYCVEPGQDVKAFKADIDVALKMAAKSNIALKSLVFPRNQIREDYLEVCNSAGIVNVRSNPLSWYWKDASSNSLSTKLARTGDAYFSLGKKSYSPLDLNFKPNRSLEQKASRFLRPVEGNLQLRKLKMNRILSEMTHAAKANEIYHLWWHPHNFGDKPEESIQDLIYLMKHFKFLNLEYNFKSLHMGALGDQLLKS